ncbi:MAG TPA: AbrB/MazE/SpoVT family DNA-binding domain-containing protein [Candidatus Saccharimonadia bacterium]|nr:AbrB/MazE/SpoVT family DNA-binding domain-containing protein [Candidatus Saccharimonadia bacterium]
MNKHTNSPQSDCLGMVTLGERGQVVIPQAIREQVGLNAGDKLMVFVKHGQMIGLVPQAAFRDWIEQLGQQLTKLDDTPKPAKGDA